MVDFRNCCQISSNLSIHIIDPCILQVVNWINRWVRKTISRNVQKSLNRCRDIKRNIRAKSHAIVFHRVGAKIGAGNAEARRTGTRHNFTPFYPMLPLYEFREQLEWDGATGLRLCESWVKRDRNYARTADGDKAVIQELHFPKLQQLVSLSLSLPPSPPLSSSLFRLPFARSLDGVVNSTAAKRARIYTWSRRGSG